MTPSLAHDTALFWPSSQRLAKYDSFRVAGYLLSPTTLAALLEKAHTEVREGTPRFVEHNGWRHSCPVLGEYYERRTKHRLCRRWLCPSCRFRDLVNFRDAIVHSEGHQLQWIVTPNGYRPRTQVVFATYERPKPVNRHFNLETAAKRFLERLKRRSGPDQPIAVYPNYQVRDGELYARILVAVVGKRSTIEKNIKVLPASFDRWERVSQSPIPRLVPHTHALDMRIGTMLQYPELMDDLEQFNDLRLGTVHRLNGAGSEKHTSYRTAEIGVRALPPWLRNVRELTEDEWTQQEAAGMPTEQRLGYIRPTLRFPEVFIWSTAPFGTMLSPSNGPQQLIDAEEKLRHEIESRHPELTVDRIECPRVFLKKLPDDDEAMPAKKTYEACKLPTCPSCVMRQNMRLVSSFLRSKAWNQKLRQTHTTRVHPTAAVGVACIVRHKFSFDAIMDQPQHLILTNWRTQIANLRKTMFRAMFDPTDYAAAVFRPTATNLEHQEVVCISFVLFENPEQAAKFERRVTDYVADDAAPEVYQHNIVDQASVAAMVGDAARYEFNADALTADPNLLTLADHFGQAGSWFSVRMTKALRPRIPLNWKVKRGRRSSTD